MSPRSLFVSLSVAAVATTAFLAGCSSDSSSTSPAESAPADSASSPAGSPAASSPAASPSESPTDEASTPTTSENTSGGTDVSGAGGKVAWVMPCDKPEELNQKLNESDKRTVVKVDGWRCGQPPNTTAGAFVAELAKTPTSEADATRQLLTAADQLAKGDKPKRSEFLGHPGVTKKITQNGKTFALQGVAVDKYMVIFMAPADKLDVLTDTVTIS